MSIAGHTKTLPADPQGLRRGDRVEVPAYSDLWMRGARFGTVTRIYRHWRNGLGAANSFDRILAAVRLDHPDVKRLGRFISRDCRKVQP